VDDDFDLFLFVQQVGFLVLAWHRMHWLKSVQDSRWQLMFSKLQIHASCSGRARSVTRRKAAASRTPGNRRRSFTGCGHNHGFFYRPKVADISEIFFLSPGSNKI
jgi:hypothetical protein